MGTELLKLNVVRRHLWPSPQPEVWEKNATDSRLAGLISTKKGESYAKAIPWIRAKKSFSVLRFALLCLRGSLGTRQEH